MSWDPSNWLDALIADRSVPEAMEKVISVLRRDPQAAAFATVTSMAAHAGVNMATVTRTGQFLGYSGWPALALDYRGQYLASLRAGTVVSRDAGSIAPGPRGRIQQDRRVLESLAETLDEASVTSAARRLRESRRSVVLATGMYLAPALMLSHNCQLLGYDSELPMVAESTQLNAVDKLGPDDTLVVFTIWKTADIVFRLTRYAHSRGVPVIAFADRTTPVSDVVDLTLAVPTEGTSYLPSAIPVVSTVQAVLSTLADIDPEAAAASFAEADRLWSEMGIVGEN